MNVPTIDLSVSQVAKELQTRRETVKRLLESGELAGYVIDPAAARKSYRITRQALDEFKARRSAKKTTPAKAKALPKPKHMVQYF